MAFQIEIIGNALVVTNTVTSEVLVDTPAKLVYYRPEELINGNIRLVNIDEQQQTHRNLPQIPLVDSVDSGGSIAFTEVTWRTFARTNLG